MSVSGQKGIKSVCSYLRVKQTLIIGAVGEARRSSTRAMPLKAIWALNVGLFGFDRILLALFL